MDTITIKVKTNLWPEPGNLTVPQLSCLPLPAELQYSGMKHVTVNIANPLPNPEEAVNYLHLWAGFVNRITVPETFTYSVSCIDRLTPIFTNPQPWDMPFFTASRRQITNTSPRMPSMHSLSTLQCCDANCRTSPDYGSKRSSRTQTVLWITGCKSVALLATPPP